MRLYPYRTETALAAMCGLFLAAQSPVALANAKTEEPYSVACKGIPQSLERVGTNQVAYYTRLRVNRGDPVTVQVATAREIRTTVQPDSRANTVRIDKNTLHLVLDSAGARILHITADGKLLPPLFLIAEPDETGAPDRKQPEVLDATRFGARPNSQPQTAALQKALDACAALATGGIVYIPEGCYLTGTLRVQSNTRLYLAAGAVLRAVDDPTAFPPDTGQTESGDEGIHHSHSRLLLFDRARHSGLFGRGTLDGNGAVLRNRHKRRVQLIDAHDCRDLCIEGVVLRNTASWTLHILHCDGVRVTDVKILTDWDVANSDGIDPDSSRNVLIERLFCYSGDDAIAVKTTGNANLLQSSHSVTVADSILMTRKTALKVGTETRADIRDVTFENIDVVHSSRGMAVWARDGGTLSNITFRNIRMDLVEIPREKMSGQPLLLTNEKRHGESMLRNVTIEKITCRAPWFSQIQSKVAAPIEHVTIRDLKLTVLPRADKQDCKPLVELTNARNVLASNWTVDWTQARPQQWSGLWNDAAAVRTDTIHEISPPSRP